MRLDQMPYHSMPTLAVLPFRQFGIGWSWQLRALKLFPDSLLAWKRYFYDNGQGHARCSSFSTFAEAMIAADAFNQSTSEHISNAVHDPVIQASITLKVDKALTAARRIQDEEELMECEAVKRNAHLPRPAIQDLELPSKMDSLRQPLHEQLERTPYLQVVALTRLMMSTESTDTLPTLSQQEKPCSSAV